MRGFATIFILFIFLSGNIYAQKRARNGSNMIKRLKAEKISYLATELELTPKEAQKFWPVYNEYEKLRFELQIKRNQIDQRINNDLDTMSDSEIEKTTGQVIDISVKEADLTKEYNAKFLEVLPARKVLKLYYIEKEFRSHMLREFRRRQMVDSNFEK